MSHQKLPHHHESLIGFSFEILATNYIQRNILTDRLSTRMHSSRMRTGRALTVSGGGVPAGGGACQGGGVPARVGVPATGGGVACRGGVPARGGCLPGGT